MLNLSRFRRPRRAGEWTDGKAVTFIVTLAAHRNVTLAAACSVMGRKSAYALKRRDPCAACGTVWGTVPTAHFAAAWGAAVAAGALSPHKGDKGNDPHNPRVGVPLGYTGSSAATRDCSFEELLRRLRDSGPRPLAPPRTLA